MSKITDRIEAETGLPRLVEALSAISPSDLQSLLLAVFQNRARGLREADVIGRSSPLTEPSSVDARRILEFDRAAFEAAAGFEAVDLSPVAPVGASFVLGGIDPNSVITTIRNTEVLGDSTEALALECARRRKQDRKTEVRLAASHRVIRMQPFDVPGFTPHFRLFALVSAGRDSGSHEFERKHLIEHIRFYLNLCRALKIRSPRVELSDLRVTADLLGQRGVDLADVRREVRAHWPGSTRKFLDARGIELPESDPRLDSFAQTVFAPLAAEFPEAEFAANLHRLEGFGYYTGLCLRVSPKAPDGARYAVADGGFTGWTARLIGDRKERLLTSGIGSEVVCRLYL